MEEPIKKDDLVVNGALASIKKDIDALTASTNKWDEELKQAAETLKNAVGGTNKTTLENLNKLNAAEKESARLAKEKKTVLQNQNLLDQEKAKLQKQILVEEAKLKVARSDENKQLQELRAQKNAENKAIRDGIRDKENDKNAYSKLSRESREFKNESKRLGAELLALGSRTEKNAATWDKLEKEYKQVTQQAITTDAQLKKIDATVGDNQRNVGNYKDALGGLNGALGALGLALGVGQVASGIFNFNKDLDTATNTARMFFKTTDEGSKALAQEATILGKVWGKETNEVLLAANVLTKEFGISGEEALAKINDGFNKGADVQGEFLSNIKEYSSQLTQAGLTAEQTIALITQSQEAGVFSDKGVDAIKEAQLSLREMTKPAQEALAAIGMSGEELQKQIQSGQKTYFEAIQEISAKTNEFGIGSQEAGMILADVFKGAGEDAGQFIFSLDKLNLNLDEMDDASQGMDAALGNLTRSFYEFMFGVNDAGGVTDKFAVGVQFLADNLGTILSTLGTLVFSYIKYIAIVKSANALQFTFNGGLTKIGKNLIIGAKGMVGFARGTRSASTAMRGLGMAMKSIPFVAIIGLLIDLAMTFYDVADAAAEARRQQELIEAGKQKSQEFTSRIIQGEKAAHEERMRLLDEEIRKRKANGEDENTLEQERIKREAEITESTQKRIDAQAVRASKEFDIINRLNDIAEKGTIKRIGQQKTLSDLDKKALDEYVDLISQAEKFTEIQAEGQSIREMTSQKTLDLIIQERTTRGENIKAFLSESKEYRKALSENQVQEIELNSEQQKHYQDEKDRLKDRKNSIKGIRDQTKSIKDLALSYKELDEILAGEDKDGGASLSERMTAQMDALNRELTKRTTAIKQQLLDGEITEEEARLRQLELELLYLEKRKQLLVDYGEDVTDINAEIVDKELQITDEILNKKNTDLKKDLNERVELIRDANELITEIITSNIDRRLEEYDREIEAARRTQDELKQLAAEGNITAQQSIKEERQNEIEALAEKQKLEEQKNAIKLISSGVSTYLQQIEGGAAPGEAFANTVTSLVALKEFLSGFNFFAKGTENAPEGKAVVDEQGAEAIIRKKTGKIEIGTDKGARMTWLNKGDIVKTAPETKKLLNNLSMVENAPAKMDNAGTSYDLLGRKLDRLIEVSQNGGAKSQYDFDPVMKELVKRTNTNGDTHVSRYRVKHR